MEEETTQQLKQEKSPRIMDKASRETSRASIKVVGALKETKKKSERKKRGVEALGINSLNLWLVTDFNAYKNACTNFDSDMNPKDAEFISVL
jgi:hypothetical protein